MRKRQYKLPLIILILFCVTQCAQRGNPTGGPEDEAPPSIVSAFPANYSTNFENQQITIRFNEFVKFNDLQKQLVISPPLKNRPIILPQGGVAKEISIYIRDTLKDNTTYVLNFGQSVVDNTEGNAYPFLKYVFSTGAVIDSLTLQGRVSSAFKFKTDDFVSVLLYEVDSTYTDSAVYNQAPNYVLNTLDSLTSFTMENLKAGEYRMIALKEKSTNLRFNPAADRIGFVTGNITVPTDEVYDLRLYDPIPPAEVKRAFAVSPRRIDLGYVGSKDSIDVRPFNSADVLESRFTQMEDIDTLNYWFKPREGLDSLMLRARYRGVEDTLKVRFKKNGKDSLTLEQYGKFSLRSPAQFQAGTPITSFDKSKMLLMDMDSIAMDFDLRLDSLKNVMSVDFPKTEKQRYTLQLLPGAVNDFLGNQLADTLAFNYSTKKITDLANVIVTLKNGDDFPVIVQLLNSSDMTVLAQERAAKNRVVEFNYMDPGSFQIRIIYDQNDNGQYDPGDFLRNFQPERVQYSPVFPVQSNWDDMRTINLE